MAYLDSHTPTTLPCGCPSILARVYLDGALLDRCVRADTSLGVAVVDEETERGGLSTLARSGVVTARCPHGPID